MATMYKCDACGNIVGAIDHYTWYRINVYPIATEGDMEFGPNDSWIDICPKCFNDDSLPIGRAYVLGKDSARELDELQKLTKRETITLSEPG